MLWLDEASKMVKIYSIGGVNSSINDPSRKSVSKQKGRIPVHASK